MELPSSPKKSPEKQNNFEAKSSSPSKSEGKKKRDRNDSEDEKVTKNSEGPEAEQDSKRGRSEDGRKIVVKNQDVVRSHFNARPRHDLASRNESEIIHLRSFNNWIKSIIVQQFVKPNQSVLDLACGKGGDLWKWHKIRVGRLVGIDIAEKSIEEAKSRFESMSRNGKPPFDASFMVGNAFSSSEVDRLVDDEKFDAISCQFAFHYAFGSRETAEDAFKCISKHLKPNGVFFFTIPNASRLIELLDDSDDGKYGNSLYNIKFESTDMKKYGWKYTFFLKDAIDSCPEFIVLPDVVRQLAKIHGLEIIFQEAFPNMFYQYQNDPNYSKLLEKMRVLNSDNTISPEEWDVISLYSAFCLKKVSSISKD